MVPTNVFSPLSDVLRCVVSIFGLVADATPIQVGEQYLKDFGVGLGPKILFVPDPKGKAGDPPAGSGGTGCIGGVTHGCDLYVRGAEDGSDIGRFDSAYALATKVRNAIERAARGRTTWTDYRDKSPIGTDSAYGADFALSFTYVRGEQRDAAIWKLPSNPIAASPPDINKPDGTTPSTVGPLSLTVVPLEP